MKKAKSLLLIILSLCCLAVLFAFPAAATADGITRTCADVGGVRATGGYTPTLSNSIVMCVCSSHADGNPVYDFTGCDTAKPDTGTIAAYFGNMDVHCPYCWSTNVTYKEGKGYRCYTCHPKGNVIQERFDTFRYFSEF